jgi:hypothetical protein
VQPSWFDLPDPNPVLLLSVTNEVRRRFRFLKQGEKKMRHTCNQLRRTESEGYLEWLLMARRGENDPPVIDGLGAEKT